MTLDEMKEKARERVQNDNPEGKDFKATKIYENVLGGTVVTVAFSVAGKEESNHVLVGPEGLRIYRWHSDIIQAVSASRERIWFFRFIELAGIGGFIACVLVLVFSALLCVLAFRSPDSNSTILELVKLSFTLILGFFFGSQSAGKRTG
jgi:hypothetical protein